MRYMAELWNRNKYLQSYFDSNDNFHMAVAKFFILIALAVKPSEMGRPIYPGYRLLPQARRAMSSLTSRMFSSEAYLNNIAGAIGDTAANLKETWAIRVKVINEVSSGEWSPFRDEVGFPSKFGEEAPS
jgi:hypothetical protein